ncbi:ABC transporter permease [Algicella marina]|uniref:ABC transporter permease n=1 Tax=Algicella marina TaxID=2683284 RepID=A0A6P1T1M5_9RHOB|nr:ABC transporter permease [Algicella marina]QHQ35710.1 ABC transporter permease [Algicella marina]
MLTLEPRTAGPLRQVLTPVLAIVATMIAGGILFMLLGKNPVEAIKIIFVDPLFDAYSRSELLVKAAPLALIATGLSFGYRANVWNIGAEGQFILGAICGGAVGLAFYGIDGWFVLPLMAVAGMLGGFAWAMIPAFLRTRFNANEILVSLMLVYVATLLLSALVSGPLRDPDGFNFPESRQFHDSATLPILLQGTRVHIGIVIALLVSLVGWLVLQRHVFGFQIKLMGAAPRAAHFAGVSTNRMVYLCLGISGALAGLAGMFEAAGPVGQLVPSLPAGYGFTAIIVAFLGRLHPAGIILASLVLALTIIGGETAQYLLQVPKAAISVFQGMLLFFLLAFEIFTRFRLRRSGAGATA